MIFSSQYMTILFWHFDACSTGVTSHCARVLPLTTWGWLSNVVVTLPGPTSPVLPLVCGQYGIGFQEEVEEDAAWTKTCTEPTVPWELQIVSDDVVQAVLTPAVHVASAAHASHGALPDPENVVPATHGASLQVFVVQSQ